jgi:2-polyprenyl-3-methyl-5-hydroxy-6-metoxy-1,4-benzoquinol methylase
MPEGEFDLVICCDVMEHIPMAEVGRVLSEIKRKSDKALFTISMRPARARLPDGRNAHVTLLTAKEWMRWIKDVFGSVAEVEHDKSDHILMARTW